MPTKRTLFLGSLLGAGLIWLNTTKKGKEVRDQALDYAVDVYERVKDEIMKSDAWDKMTKTKFAAMVSDVTDEYSREHGIGDNIKRIIVKIVNSQWGNLKRESRRKRAST